MDATMGGYFAKSHTNPTGSRTFAGASLRGQTLIDLMMNFFILEEAKRNIHPKILNSKKPSKGFFRGL